MGEKKYFWLKLKRDFFKRHDIRIIEEMPNGKEYILFYLKLLLESIDHEGTLRFSDTIPYNEQMLSVITNTNVDIVRSAMKIFSNLNMVEILADETIYMAEVEKLIGSETKWAEKKRIQRERDNVPLLSSKCPTEIDIELQKEKDIRDNNIIADGKKHKYGEHKNVLLTDAELEKLKDKFPDYQERIERLSEGIALKGYKYKSHYLAILNWARNDKPSEVNSKKQSANPFLNVLKEDI